MADFTNFACISGGDNTNAGTRTGNATVPGTGANLTYAGGAWVNATKIFTPVAANPITDGVAVGDYCNIGGTYINRVTARDATTITFGGSGAGTNPGNGTLTVKLGGAWSGPSGASGFPFTLSNLSNLSNAAGTLVRINIKNDLTPTVSAVMTMVTPGNVWFQGFTTAYGDGGVTQITGGASGASFTILDVKSSAKFADLDFFQNGSTGNAVGVTCGSGQSDTKWLRCSFRGMKGNGLTESNNNTYIESCQFDSNGGSGLGNTSGGGLYQIYTSSFTRNGSDALSVGTHELLCLDSVFAGNTGVGATSQSASRYRNCDFWNNTGSGVQNSGGNTLELTSCNFLKNGAWGIDLPATGFVRIRNCGFGVGTQANTSGDIETGQTGCTIVEEGTVNYATGVTPWNAPTTGDFTTTLAAAQGTGYGPFLNRASAYGGTLNFPNIGASQQALTTYSDPGIANVRSGTGYTFNSVSLTGTCSVPTAANVRLGTAVDATTGTCVVPAAADVKSGVSVDATTGTLLSTNPGAANVLAPTPYSINSVSFTGTLVATTPAPTVSSLGRMGIGL